MGCAECFERPHFHLTEALTTELRLTTQRLLCDEGVWANAPSVHLVINQVAQFQHVNHAYGGHLVESRAGLAIKEVSAAPFWQAGLLEVACHILGVSAIKDRGGKFQA